MSRAVIGCAIEVHRSLGPRLLEPAYHRCLEHELTLEKVPYQSEVPLPVRYKGTRLDCGYRMDLVIHEHLTVELKSVRKIEPIHEAQLLTYMRLSGLKVGLLINFNVPLLREGIRRFVINQPMKLCVL
ncbi:GxxExxY protein [Sulfuriroseicoccus oceanibius]|uniref:GxxExxY protein n=1 Tax=Sulfuriroseicoccus oceanibius TaxID=2707525 RepID=A0A6B3L5D2_9BACT|nr:GxxExxY protein [Sulfuriroseicoccus oceanibius]